MLACPPTVVTIVGPLGGDTRGPGLMANVDTTWAPPEGDPGFQSGADRTKPSRAENGWGDRIPGVRPESVSVVHSGHTL